MKKMILKLKYFGMIAEALSKEAEEIELNITSIQELKDYLVNQNSVLDKLNFKIAVNHKLVHLDSKLNNNDEVALLPPFAGG